MRKIALALSVVMPVVAGAQALAAASPETFVWRGVANAPPSASDTSYYLHRSSPRDALARDVHFECRKGDEAIDATFISATRGSYAYEELLNTQAEAVFVVDGKRLAPVTVTLMQEEGFGASPITLGIRYQLEVDEPLFAALAKGKSFRFELAKARSHLIPLAGFARRALAMKKHCF